MIDMNQGNIGTTKKAAEYSDISYADETTNAAIPLRCELLYINYPSDVNPSWCPIDTLSFPNSNGITRHLTELFKWRGCDALVKRTNETHSLVMRRSLG